MRISGKKRRQLRQQHIVKHRYKSNEYIKSPRLQVIDENGTMVGEMDTKEALALARERGYDLVEVSPVANPPVAKILDYSKMRYQEEKERKQQKVKQKKVGIKGIRLSLRIGQHDMEVRAKQALKFFEEGHKVKIEMILRGREKGHIDLAKKNVNEFIALLQAEKPVKVETPVSVQGGRLSVILSV